MTRTTRVILLIGHEWVGRVESKRRLPFCFWLPERKMFGALILERQAYNVFSAFPPLDA
jgi:hypothetical protein